MKSVRVPVPIQILAMIVALSLGGALVLFGQLTPSEESDWPWKVVTEADVFLNGAPAGSLSDLTPLGQKFGDLIKQGRRSGKFEEICRLDIVGTSRRSSHPRKSSARSPFFPKVST